MKTEFELRVAGADDAAAVDALLEASYGTLLATRYSAEQLAAALPPMTKSSPKLLSCGTFYVAQSSGGALIGCGGWTAETPGSGEIVAGVGHVRHFATHPDWTRRGVARALILRCEEEAGAEGIETFDCYSSLVAEEFYAALGFRTIKDMEIELSAGVRLPAILMRRELT